METRKTNPRSIFTVRDLIGIILVVIILKMTLPPIYKRIEIKNTCKDNKTCVDSLWNEYQKTENKKY